MPPMGARMAALTSAVALVAMVILTGATPAPALGIGEEGIHHITVDLTANRDGTLDVVETIAYDFGVVPKHGIIRVIPDRRRFDAHHDRRYPIAVTSVTASAGASAHRSVSQHGSDLQIKIGDSKRTISGPVTYVIAYTVSGAFDRFADHDELTWNAVGTEWSVPDDGVTVTLHTPAAITRVACEAGYTDSRLGCTSAASTGTTAQFTEGPLGGNQGVTIVAALPRDTVLSVGPILAKHWTFDQGFAVTRATITSAIALLVLLLGALALMVWRVGRDRRYVGGATDAVFGNPTGASTRVSVFEDHTTPVEYTPPDGLRPGQVGTLVDEVAGPLDVSATIVDLAVRKYLRIEEVPKQHWFGHVDWKLTRLELNDPLLQYERLLLDALFASSKDGTVLLSSLKQKFHTSLVSVESALYDDAVARGWFLRRPDKARAFWHQIALGSIFAGAGITFLLARYTSFGIAGLPVVIAGLVLSACSHAMPRRTPQGTGATRRVLGFRRFIAESERDRARFAEQQNLFSEYLPYAIVFGVVDRWARTFEGLAAPDVSWYQSSTPFNAIAFSHSINGFAVTSVGTLGSSPAGSGGSGFSGGVGGGGGGGGGGSW
jgi:Predicted membrane protein (DUF2207)